MKRPGISQEMLVLAGVREVNEDQSQAAVGFAAPGLLIPYITRRGDPIKVDGRTFARIRLNEPKGSAKYLYLQSRVATFTNRRDSPRFSLPVARSF